jgi:hypothetical protein
MADDRRPTTDDQMTQPATIDARPAAHFSSYDEFFAYYVGEHSHPANRVLHAIGTTAALSILVFALATQRYALALLWIPLGYGFAWFGHFVFEKNRPATFAHPWWSFISDFRMLALMLTGRLGPWLARTKANRAD